MCCMQTNCYNKSPDSIDVDVCKGVLPEARRAVAGPGLPRQPDQCLLPPEAALQLPVEKAKGEKLGLFETSRATQKLWQG